MVESAQDRTRQFFTASPKQSEDNPNGVYQEVPKFVWQNPQMSKGSASIVRLCLLSPIAIVAGPRWL